MSLYPLNSDYCYCRLYIFTVSGYSAVAARIIEFSLQNSIETAKGLIRRHMFSVGVKGVSQLAIIFSLQNAL